MYAVPYNYFTGAFFPCYHSEHFHSSTVSVHPSPSDLNPYPGSNSDPFQGMSARNMTASHAPS